GARHERGDLPRRGQRVQRPADVHPRQPQAGRARCQARHQHHQLPALDDQPRGHLPAGRQGRHRRAQGPGRLDDPVPRLPGARLDLEPVALEPRQRLPLAVRGFEPHPALQAPGLYRAPRLQPDPVPARRLPAQAIRRAAAVEERHAAGRAQGGMNLYAKLLQRKDKPIRVGLIGAGKFAAMYLAQVPKTPGIRLVGIADLAPDNARANLARVGWDAETIQRTPISDNWEKLVAHPEVDIVIEATGNPPAAVEHALAAFRNKKHVVMVTVEADAFCGPLLAKKAAEAGVVYSLAYGDQPALICDLVDWARAAGFPVVAAGRGHKWLPHFAQSTPETVWGHYGLTPEEAKVGGLNPKMFNSFLDGSKPAIETTAVCNATGLTPAPDGLAYPAGSVDEIPSLMRPVSEGGVLHHK